MRSIRWRLIVGTVLSTFVTIVVLGTVLYGGMRAALVEGVDEALDDKAGSVASLIAVTPDGIEADFDDLDMEDFEEGGGGYLQVWVDGDVLFVSPGVGDGELVPAAHGGDAFVWLELPDGGRGRSVTRRFAVAVDNEDFEDAGYAPEQVAAVGRPAATIVLARETDDVDDVLARLRTLLFVVGIAVQLLAAFILAWVVRRGLGPLDQLAREIAGLSDAGLSTVISMPGAPAEVVPVVDQLNAMLRRLQHAFQRERNLGANVAHELRTPLAGIRSELEVSLAKVRDADEYRRALGDALDIVTRMQATVESLMYLGRLEAGLVPVEKSTIDLHGLLESSWRGLEAAADRRQLHVSINVPAGLDVTTDPMLLSVAIRNILENAATYCDDNGRVAVDALSHASGVTLRVVNTGSRVSAEDIENVTAPFWRGDQSRTGTGNHSGLGLAIVKKVAFVLGCDLEMSSDIGGEFLVALTISR